MSRHLVCVYQHALAVHCPQCDEHARFVATQKTEERVRFLETKLAATLRENEDLRFRIEQRNEAPPTGYSSWDEYDADMAMRLRAELRSRREEDRRI